MQKQSSSKKLHGNPLTNPKVVPYVFVAPFVIYFLLIYLYPTITTILARHYITKENKNLYVTELGEAVNAIMKQSFTTIVDERFTANMESLLDKIEEGEIQWKTVVRNFYPDLKEAVEKAEKELEKVQIADEVTDVKC